MVQVICMFFQKEISHCRKISALVPVGPKYYIFGDQFYSKNARKLRFHVFLNCQDRKHVISWIYLRRTEFARNFDYCFNYGSPWTQTKLEQSSQFLANYVHFRQNYGIMFSSIKMEEWIYGIWVFWHFSSKTGRQKYSVWVPGDLIDACEG